MMLPRLPRLKDLWSKPERFTEGAAILTITTFGSYIAGLFRDRIFARTFGASRDLDLYNASFIIPDLLLNILVAGGISAAFIPIFSSLRAVKENNEANELANSVLHAAMFVIILAGALAALFMPWLITHVVAPGFSETEQIRLISLSRLMLISPVFMALSQMLGALLLSFKRFLSFGLSPIFYNIGIIGGTFFVDSLGISALVLGTIAGALLHAGVRFLGIQKSDFRYGFLLNFRDRNFLRVVRLMIPKMVGHPVEQLTFLGFNRIATTLAAGSLTVVSFARNFQSVPVSLFGIAFSVAIFPTLAECAGRSDRESFLKNFWKALRDIVLFTVPAVIGFYFLSDIPIRIFLGGGKFSDENILRTAQVLSAFSFSILTESLVHLLARSFYALKNTIIPVLMSVLGLIISVSFAMLRSGDLGILSIPYGFLLGSLTEVVLLSLLLRRSLLSFHRTYPPP